MESQKACTACKRVLPLEAFPRCARRAKIDGRAWWCKQCHRAACHAWYRKNIAAEKIRGRARQLRRYYQISPERYDQLFVAQNGRCAICNVRQDQLIRRLDVDHSHETGEVRGLLCTQCNRLLGRVENKGWLIPALAYLGFHAVPSVPNRVA